MGKFENRFLSLLKEEPVPAGDANPADDAQSFAGSLDQPENAGDFEDVQDNQPNTAHELKQLQEWVDNIDEVIQYLILEII